MKRKNISREELLKIVKEYLDSKEGQLALKRELRSWGKRKKGAKEMDREVSKELKDITINLQVEFRELNCYFCENKDEIPCPDSECFDEVNSECRTKAEYFVNEIKQQTLKEYKEGLIEKVKNEKGKYSHYIDRNIDYNSGLDRAIELIKEE